MKKIKDEYDRLMKIKSEIDEKLLYENNFIRGLPSREESISSLKIMIMGCVMMSFGMIYCYLRIKPEMQTIPTIIGLALIVILVTLWIYKMNEKYIQPLFNKKKIAESQKKIQQYDEKLAENQSRIEYILGAKKQYYTESSERLFRSPFPVIERGELFIDSQNWLESKYRQTQNNFESNESKIIRFLIELIEQQKKY